MSSLKLLLIAFLFITTNPLRALTLADLAGIYVGHRTETFENEVKRYQEISIISEDGQIQTWLYRDGNTYNLGGHINIDPDGTITEGGGDEGHLPLNGKHLGISMHWLDIAPFGEATIEANLHRAKKMPEFHTPGH